MPEIILYQFAKDKDVESASPFCAKVHRLLVFKGLDYEKKNVGSPGEMQRLNPGVKKLPVLGYDGELIADSSKIRAFLEERHPEPSFWPADPAQKGLARVLEDWGDEALYWFAVHQRWGVDSSFEPFAKRTFGRMPIPLRWFVPKMVRRQVVRDLHGQGFGRLSHEKIYAQFDEHLDALDSMLGAGQFLLGEQPTAADIAIFAPLKALSVRETMGQSAEVLRRHAPVMAWLKRVDEATTGRHTLPLSA